MPFSNPLVAGDEIIYPVRVSGPSASFEAMSVSDTFSYRGVELSDIVFGYAKGIVGHLGITPGALSVVTPAEIIIGYLDVPAEPNRMYRVWSNDLSTGSGSTQAEFMIRFTTNGTVPTTSSTILCSTNRISLWSCGIMQELVAGIEGTLRFALTMKAHVGTPTLYYIGQVRMTVEDIGEYVAHSGVAAAPGGSAQWRTFDIQPTATRSYMGNGAYLGYDNQYMMQGDVGIDGNRRSWAWFDQNSAGLGSGGSIANLVGVGAGNISYVKLFLFYPHWYYSTGGRAVVGHHNSTTISNTEPGGGTPREIFNTYTARNQGKWIDLTGSAIQAAMMAGTFKGFMLGNTADSSFNDYGYAYGANGINGQQPGLQARYYK